MSLYFIDLIVFSLFTYFAYRAWVQFTRRGLPLPPGPRGLPLIGNLLDVPQVKPHLAYTKMSEEYQSDLIFMQVPGVSLLVINSAQAANDLLVERFKVYSDRPQAAMGKLAGVDESFIFNPYNEEWRKKRLMFMQEVSPTNLQKYQKPCMQENVDVLLNSLLDSPEKYEDHIHIVFAATVLSMAFGISPEREESFDHFVNLSKVGVDAVSDVAVPGNHLVDIVPVLQYLPEWLPGMGWKKEVAHQKKLIYSMLHDPLQFTKKKIESGATVKSSMASRQMQEMQDSGIWNKENEKRLSNILGTLYGAATDSLSSSTRNIILAFLMDPEIQKKGQAAVDEAIGSDRLPDYNDEGKIPYVDALVMEVLRWRVMLPLGIAHATQTDDIYRGYYIPAKTIVIGNAWAILHDPAVYGEDVDNFRPERFLNPDGTLNESIPDPSAAFGFGRRICAGKVMAQSALWLTVASLLACFNFSRARNAKGEEIIPDVDYHEGMIAAPHSFDCVVQPRYKAVEALIRQRKEQADLY
ncbi:hypothetical protein GYMLUDRAFT_49821 [Collybiopsis luxurians FD-317 M1]|uniref:Cytochrome P450 n=1 Tax=Collybiopsis luxurians FD-317 M1 TaxID=944289 RepID=A0A0D0AQR6_9AGAR|nr:hypothetical protein GYMLUDRAFT_49821 [Collybiopsis luxurians FD-317 M1]